MVKLSTDKQKSIERLPIVEAIIPSTLLFYKNVFWTAIETFLALHGFGIKAILRVYWQKFLS